MNRQILYYDTKPPYITLLARGTSRSYHNRQGAPGQLRGALGQPPGGLDQLPEMAGGLGKLI